MSTPIPFSFPTDVATLSQKGRDYRLTANANERAAISRALGLESLENLSANLLVIPGAGGTITVSGTFTADVVQACVVTLAPVKAHISDTIARRFAVHRAPDSAEGEEEGWVDPDAEIIDPLVDGKLDLGEVVIEHLSLALDPYPRAPGATFTGVASIPDESEASGPFAALARLKAAKASPRRADRPQRQPRSAAPTKRKT